MDFLFYKNIDDIKKMTKWLYDNFHHDWSTSIVHPEERNLHKETIIPMSFGKMSAEHAFKIINNHSLHYSFANNYIKITIENDDLAVKFKMIWK